MTTRTSRPVRAPRYEDADIYDEYEEDVAPAHRRPAPRHTVRSRPIGQTTSRLSVATMAGAVLGGVVFAGAWLAGARYTLDGWVLAVNLFLNWLNLPAGLSITGPWPRMVGIVLIGLAYSLVEVALRPRRNGSVVWAVVWALLIVSDIGSTFLGVITPREGAWPMSLWLAETWGAALAWAVVLTLGPEQGLMRIWRDLR